MAFGFFSSKTKTEEFFDGMLSMFGLEPRSKLQIYRLITCLLLPAPGRITYANFLVDLVGVHCCTWFVIAGSKNRWQKIIVLQFYIMLVICLVAAYLDPAGFIAPR